MNHPIKTYRETNGLTLEEFGAMVGVQRAVVCKWEGGKPPSVQSAMKIEAATKGKIRKDLLRPDVWKGNGK